MSFNSGPSLDLQERTLRVSNYSKNVTKSILNELFTQGGPVRNIVYKPGFSFIEFEDSDSVGYCLALFDGIELFGEKLQMAPKIQDEKSYHYLKILKQYESAFFGNPLNWWSRFGDVNKQCPKHICSYSNSYQPNTNYNNQMMINNPMYNQNNSMYNQTSFNEKINRQMMMLNQNHMMPTSSTYLDNDFSRQDRRYESSIPRNKSFNHYDSDYRKERDYNRRSVGNNGNYNNKNRNKDRNEDRNNDRNSDRNKDRNKDKYDNRNHKRTINDTYNESNKRVKKHQSF